MSIIKEKFLLNVAFPMADLVMGTKAMYWYRNICKMQTWSRLDIEKWQLEKLQKILQHAYKNTVYYKEVFDKLNLTPSDINSFSTLASLPVLTKEIIRERFEDIKPDNIGGVKHRFGSTGGSTGEPFKYILDENTWGFATATKIYSWKTSGYRYGDMFLSLGSSSLFPVNKKSFIHEVYYKLRNTIPLNGMNMDDEICKRYFEIVKKNNIRFIYGYAASVYLLARYYKKEKIEWQMKGVFTTSEKLTEEYRETIESAWNTRVMDCYGARDGGIGAYEVNPGYFNIGYSSYCETSNSNYASELYCTNLIDYAFPLIRYKIGDEVALDNNFCNKYQYNGQVFTEIIGRTSDIIQFDNGHRLTTSGFTIMFRNFNVQAYRIKKGVNNSLKIEIQKGNNFSSDEEQLILNTIKKHTGYDVHIEIIYVERFEPLKNGKRSFFLNDLE